MDLDFSPLLDSWQYLLGGLGVTSARLAMISSTGAAVPAVETPRRVAFGKRVLTQCSSPPPV